MKVAILARFTASTRSIESILLRRFEKKIVSTVAGTPAKCFLMSKYMQVNFKTLNAHAGCGESDCHGGKQFSSKLLLLPIFLGVIVGLLNLEWMKVYQLINAPKADSLVYLTEAYRDYWILRDEGIAKLFAKYVAGSHQTSPMLMWGGVVSFLFLGLSSANAYVFIAAAYLTWIAGVVYLAWQIRSDGSYAIASGILAALLPSVVLHGLRSFMLDFVAAVPFIWATAMLLKSDLLRRRREALLYGLLCGMAILFRTTIAPFFLAHLLIVIVLAVIRKRSINFVNAGLAVLVGIAVAAWFLIPNLSRILGYYGYWATVAGVETGEFSYSDNLAFYLGLLPFYHLSFSLFIFVVSWTGLAILALMGKMIINKSDRDRNVSLTVPGGLMALLLLGLVPMLILSLYPSRAASVDFPYIAAFVLIPPLLWREVMPNSKLFYIPMAVLMLAFSMLQFNYLVRAPFPVSEFQNSREREVLSFILDDAEKRGLTHISIGNTAIHQHNSTSYQFWVLANYFPLWRGKVDGTALGRTDSADELAAMNKDADYVIVLENYKADWHPNNLVAPAANRLLENRYGMTLLGVRWLLPDGVTLRVLTKKSKM
jgi:hypothetical protein